MHTERSIRKNFLSDPKKGVLPLEGTRSQGTECFVDYLKEGSSSEAIDRTNAWIDWFSDRKDLGGWLFFPQGVWQFDIATLEAALGQADRRVTAPIRISGAGKNRTILDWRGAAPDTKPDTALMWLEAPFVLRDLTIKNWPYTVLGFNRSKAIEIDRASRSFGTDSEGLSIERVAFDTVGHASCFGFPTAEIASQSCERHPYQLREAVIEDVDIKNSYAGFVWQCLPVDRIRFNRCRIYS